MATSGRDEEFAAYVAARQRALLRTAWLPLATVRAG